MDTVPEEVIADLIVPLLRFYERRRLWSINMSTSNIRNYIILCDKLITREERRKLVKVQAVWRSRMTSARVRMGWALSGANLIMFHNHCIHRGLVEYVPRTNALHGTLGITTVSESKSEMRRHFWNFSDISMGKTTIVLRGSFRACLRYHNK